jgi:hypothetical protein
LGMNRWGGRREWWIGQERRRKTLQCVTCVTTRPLNTLPLPLPHVCIHVPAEFACRWPGWACCTHTEREREGQYVQERDRERERERSIQALTLTHPSLLCCDIKYCFAFSFLSSPPFPPPSSSIHTQYHPPTPRTWHTAQATAAPTSHVVSCVPYTPAPCTYSKVVPPLGGATLGGATCTHLPHASLLSLSWCDRSMYEHSLSCPIHHSFPTSHLFIPNIPHTPTARSRRRSTEDSSAVGVKKIIIIWV